MVGGGGLQQNSGFFESSKTKKASPLSLDVLPKWWGLYSVITTHLKEQGRVETPKVRVHTHGYEKLVFFLGILGDGKKTRDIGVIYGFPIGVRW